MQRLRTVDIYNPVCHTSPRFCAELMKHRDKHSFAFIDPDSVYKYRTNNNKLEEMCSFGTDNIKNVGNET
jgi:hypothetical protein